MRSVTSVCLLAILFILSVIFCNQSLIAENSSTSLILFDKVSPAAVSEIESYGISEAEPMLSYPANLMSEEVGYSQNMLVSDGRIQLAEGSKRGHYRSPIIDMASGGRDTSFNAIMIGFDSTVPLGNNVKIFVRAFNKDGQPGEWIKIDNLEQVLLFPEGAVSYQYQVSMLNPGGSQAEQILSYNGSGRPSVGGLSFMPQLNQREQNAGYYNSQQGNPYSGYESGQNVNSGDFSIVERAQWGARQVSGYGSMNVQGIVVHHTAGGTGSDNGASTVRGIQNYHMDKNHWKDIGYHFLIDHKGNVYRGRPENAQGAHTVGKNSTHIGVSAMGNYSKESISQGNFDGVVKTLVYLCKKYGLSSSAIVPHQKYSQTACPGSNYVSSFGTLRQEVAKQLGR